MALDPMALDTAWMRREGRGYRVRDASPSEAATWQGEGSPRAMYPRTIARACDGACVTVWCHSPDEFADHCDDELAAAFDADLDAARVQSDA